MQDAPPRWQRAQGRPSGRGVAELGCGLRRRPSSGARQPPFVQTPFRRSDIRSRRRRRFLLPTPPQRPSAGAARSTLGNASGSVAESCSAGASLSSSRSAFSLPLHGSKFRRGQSEELRAEWGGRGQFICFHSFHQKINSQVLGGTHGAQG